MKLERTRREKLLGIVPTLPIWIMLAAIGVLVMLLSVLSHCSPGGSLMLEGVGPCNTAALAVNIFAILVIALGILPVLYYWNVLLVKLGWDA